MYTVPGQQKQFSSAQAGEYGVSFKSRQPVLVKYKKSKLRKYDDVQLHPEGGGKKAIAE